MLCDKDGGQQQEEQQSGATQQAALLINVGTMFIFQGFIVAH